MEAVFFDGMQFFEKLLVVFDMKIIIISLNPLPLLATYSQGGLYKKTSRLT